MKVKEVGAGRPYQPGKIDLSIPRVDWAHRKEEFLSDRHSRNLIGFAFERHDVDARISQRGRLQVNHPIFARWTTFSVAIVREDNLHDCH